MATYTSSDWSRLGQAVQEARKEAGLGKTREWATAVGKSDRTLLELERGGKVGTTTLEAIEDALEWPRAGTYRVLGGLDWRSLRTTPANPLPTYQGPTWAADADEPWVPGQVDLKNYIDGSLAAVEEDHLALEERVRKLERTLRELAEKRQGGDGHGDGGLAGSGLQVVAEAARDVGRPSRGQQKRDAVDQAGEPLTDDPDDMEPR